MSTHFAVQKAYYAFFASNYQKPDKSGGNNLTHPHPHPPRPPLSKSNRSSMLRPSYSCPRRFFNILAYRGLRLLVLGAYSIYNMLPFYSTIQSLFYGVDRLDFLKHNSDHTLPCSEVSTGSPELMKHCPKSQDFRHWPQPTCMASVLLPLPSLCSRQRTMTP